MGQDLQGTFCYVQEPGLEVILCPACLMRILLGTTPLAATPNCSSDVGEPNQEEVGSVLSIILVLSCNTHAFFLFLCSMIKITFFS